MDIIFKGFLIGGFLLIPGVSGGTMAMIFGIYDKLLSSVSSFCAHRKESFRFLFLFVIGAGAAFLLLSYPMSALVKSFPMEAAFFVAGAVIGGVPVICRSACGDAGLSCRSLFFLGLGVLLAALIHFLPEGLFQGGNGSLSGILIQIFTGILGGLALILPGVSFSSMLYLMGIYDYILGSAAKLKLFRLLPFFVGGILGILLFTKLLEHAMKRYPAPTYLMILGFVMASVWDIFAVLPALPEGVRLFECLILSGIGFFTTKYMTKKEDSV